MWDVPHSTKHTACTQHIDNGAHPSHTAHYGNGAPPANKHVAHAQHRTLRASNAEFTLHRQQFVRAQNTQHSTNRAAPHRNCARRRQHRHRLKSHTDTDTDTRSVYMFASLPLCVVFAVCTVRSANGTMKSACCALYAWGLLRGLCVCVWAIGCIERI